MIPPAAARVEAALRGAGVSAAITVLPTSIRTAAEAAAACGVAVGQIVKSLVFLAGDEPILVLTSGANQVDEARLGALTGQPVRRADAQLVRAATGFAIGGVPPVGHARHLAVFIDQDLLRYERLVAAAGTPTTVFPLTPAELCRITGGRIADIRREGLDGTVRPGGAPSCA